MSDTVIRVENLSKKYVLAHQQETGAYRYKSLRDTLTSSTKGLFSRFNGSKSESQNSSREEFWALRDVSFEIKQGDRVGIIGRNGAGKSTLLKILSRIIQPTSGSIRIKGRVASLLEVGTGFHPELTGRENIFLNGAILGMSRTEIQQKFDEIVDFAEVEKFLDTPVKRYSSGMYVRLAFAVAAHLEPEILIVDEVLAVGDVQFQQKCLGKMGRVAREGRTVLFVSHNMAAIRNLCNSAILLRNGEIEALGDTEKIANRYITIGAKSKSEYQIETPKNPNSPGYANAIFIENGEGNSVDAIAIGEAWQIRVHFKINERIKSFYIALGLITSEGVPVRTSWSNSCEVLPGSYEAIFKEKSLYLAPGKYQIVIGLSKDKATFQYTDNGGVLEISDVNKLDPTINVVQTIGVGLVLNPMEVDVQPMIHIFASDLK